MTMKYRYILLLSLISLNSCDSPNRTSSSNPTSWKKHEAILPGQDSLFYCKTYLPVYSRIYQQHKNKTYNLTVTVSLRNISLTDTVYVLTAEYFNTEGDFIRSYFSKPIQLKPLETADIIIDETDNEGGTGGNFIFNWAVKDKNVEPLFEAVMISTTGQQGMSFLTRGIIIQ